MNMRNSELPLDVVWPRLIAIADEMATTMFRTAFSHDVVEVHDMSTGLLDDRGHLMAQTWLGATGHTGCMPAFGANLVEAFPPETVNPGDVFICNDPWLCNGQTADVFITTPAFHKGKLVGFETPKRYGLVADTFTPENECLTAAMKLKRPVAAKKHAALIKAIYK